MRERTVRLGSHEFIGREARESEVEAILIPRLEQKYGQNHRLVRYAREIADKQREAELEQLGIALRDLKW